MNETYKGYRKPWEDVVEEEATEIVKDIKDRLSYWDSLIYRNSHDKLTFKKKPLTFYPGYLLVQAEIPAEAKKETHYFIWKEGEVVQLDWTSPPIHDLNARIRLVLTEDNVADYLRFFCDFVCGEEGPFTVIEDDKHPRFGGNSEPYFEKADYGKDITKDKAKKKIREELIKPVVTEPEEDGKFTTNACVWYKNALFQASLIVDAKGSIEMADDIPKMAFDFDDPTPTGVTPWHNKDIEAPLTIEKKELLDNVKGLLPEQHEGYQLKEYHLIKECNDVRWCTPLLDSEKESLKEELEKEKKRLEKEPESAKGKEDEYYKLNTIGLHKHELKRLKVTLYKKTLRDVKGSIIRRGSIDIRRGSIEIKSEDDFLISGLPDNWISLDTKKQNAEKGKWLKLAGKEKYGILQNINRIISPVINVDDTKLFRKSYEFFPKYDFYKIVVMHDVDKIAYLAFLKTATEYVEILDGEEPIYNLNKKCKIKLDKNNVKDYIRFFHDIVKTDDTTTFVESFKSLISKVDKAGNIGKEKSAVVDEAECPVRKTTQDAFENEPQSKNKETEKFKDLLSEDKEAIKGKIKLMESAEEGDGFTVTVCSLVDRKLSEARYTVKKNGHVTTKLTLLMTFSKTNVSEARESRLYITEHPAHGSLRSEPELWENGEDRGEKRVEYVKDKIIDAKKDLIFKYIKFIGDFNLEGLASDKKFVFQNCRFRGPVNLRGFASNSSLEFDRCIFENTLNFDEAQFKGGILIKDSTALKGKAFRFSITGKRMKAGYLNIMDVSTSSAINLESVTLDGDITIDNLVAQAEINLDKSSVTGGVHLKSSKRDHRFFVRGYLSLSYLKSRYLWAQGIQVDGGMYMDYSSIEQFVSFTSEELDGKHLPVKVGYWNKKSKNNLSLYGMQIGNNFLGFSGIDVAGDVNLTLAKIGSGLFFRSEDKSPLRNRMYGSLEMNGLEAPKGVWLEGVYIGKKLIAHAIQTGDLKLVPTIDLKPSTVNGEAKGQDEQKSKIQYELEVQYVEIGENIDFAHSRISGRLWFIGVGAHYEKDAGAVDEKSLDLRNVTVEGSMRFADFEKEQENILKDRKDRLKKIIDSQIISKKPDSKENFNTDSMVNQFPFGIDLSTSKIGGDLDISNVHCKKGIIDISDSNIEQNIKILPRNNENPLTTQSIACSLRANSITCGGNFNLTGLCLKRPEKGKCKENYCVGAKACAEKIRPESVVVHNATINGVLRTRERPDGDSEKEHAFAKIPGALSLEATHIGCLVISNNSFPIPGEKEDTCVYHLEKLPVTLPANLEDKIQYETGRYLTYKGVMTDKEKDTLLELSEDEEYQKAINYLFKRSQDKEKNAIILRQSYIETMRVYFGKKEKDKLFPRPVDLQFANIKYWDFKNLDNLNDKGDESEIADNYIEFLETSKKISIHTYRAVENTLFNQGNERAADDIHKALKERLCREGNILVKSGGWIWGHFTGHGTSAFLPFVLVILWLALSTFLFSSDYRYAISPSEEGLSATNTKLDEYSHPPDTWYWLDGFMVAIRYHIPIANLDPRNEWEPTNKTPPNGPNWFVPEDYALFVAIVHWALIPIIVFIFSKQILRRRGVG